LVIFTGLIIFTLVIGWASLGQAQGADKAMPEGKKLFEDTCADCHRTNGQGLPDKFPALDKNAFVVGEPTKVIDTVLNGRKGKFGQMPNWKETFNDQKLAAILTYVRQAWSNKGTPITADMVKKRRK
jgi:cytochrome c6